jgi:CBS-domain-containing membrane protein
MAAAAIVGAHARRDPDRIGQAERLDTARPRITSQRHDPAASVSSPRQRPALEEDPVARRIARHLIRDVMSSRPVTVGPRMPVRELHRLFVSHDFNAFPVVDESRILLGIVTKLDFLRIFRHDPARLRPSLTELWAEHVKDIMRRRVVALEPRDPVTTAIDRMLGSRLRSLPVVEGRGRKDVLVGIVSRGDVIRSLIVE